MSYLIDRQAAIEAIQEQIIARLDWLSDSRMERKGLDVALCALLDLPSAEPEIIRCKDCKHNYSKKQNKHYNHEDIVCDFFDTDGLNDDDFCSYGERRIDE